MTWVRDEPDSINDDDVLMQLVEQELQDFEQLALWHQPETIPPASDSKLDLHWRQPLEEHQDSQAFLKQDAWLIHDELQQLQSQVTSLQKKAMANEDWKAHAYHELLGRLRSEAEHQQLLQVLHKHVAVARQIHHIITRRVQRDKFQWRLYGMMQSLTNASKQKLSNRVQATSATPCESQVHSQHQTRYMWLLQRLEWSRHQLDSVFQNHLFAKIPEQLVTSLAPYHQVEICHGDGNEGPAWVEMVGSTVTCLDVISLQDMLWLCFSLKKPGRGCSEDAPLGGEDTATDPFKKQIVGDTINWDAEFDTCFGHRRATLHVTTILQRLRQQDAFLSEGIGRMRLHRCETLEEWSLPDQIDFIRSVWYRVQPLPDGRSVIHHVHRIQPLDDPALTDPDTIRSQQCPGTTKLLTKVVQRAHCGMSQHCKRVILNQFLSVHRRSEAYSRGWPLDGDLF